MTHAPRVVVVGAGDMGALHLRVLAEAHFAELALVVDPNPATAALAERYGAAYAASLEAVLGRRDIDAALIAAPDPLHAELAAALLEDGKAVFLEKPIAHTFASAQKVLDVAQRTGSRLFVGHTARFDPRYVSVAEAVADGVLGDCIHVSAGRLTYAELGRRVGAWTNTAIHLGVHDIDAVQWITQDRIDRVFARPAHGGLTEGAASEVAMLCTFELARNGVGQLLFGWSRPDNWPGPVDSRFEFCGTRGVGRVTSHDDGGLLFDECGPHVIQAVYGRVTNGVVTGAHYESLRHFFTALADDAPFLFGPEQGAAAVAVCDAIARSAESGNPEAVEQGALV